MNNLILKLHIVFMCFIMTFSTPVVFANSYSGGWTQTDVIRQGATSLYNGIKRDGETVMRGVAKFTPTVGMVAKAIVRGGAVGAVLTAVEVLINTTQVELIQEGNQHYFRSTVGQYCVMNNRKICFADKSAAENYAKKIWSEDAYWSQYVFQRCETDLNNKDIFMCKFAKGDDIRVTAFVIDRPKVTVEAVAGQVITDANSGSSDARKYVGTVADAEVTDEQKVAGWNETAVSANPADTGANTGVNTGAGEGANTGVNTGAGEGAENPSKENNPPADAPPTHKPFELPGFCGWASTVCDFVDWVKQEPKIEKENTKADIDDIDLRDYRSTAQTNYISTAKSCPSDLSIPINWGRVSDSINISYEPFCHFATMIKPAVILGAWISGMMIVVGGRSKE